MRFLRGFNKVLGVILYIFGVLFLVAFTLGAFLTSIYLILMPWVAMPVVTDTDMLALDLELKVFISSMGGILLFVLLLMTYLEIDRSITGIPHHRRVAPPLTPKPPKPETKRKPILG